MSNSIYFKACWAWIVICTIGCTIAGMLIATGEIWGWGLLCFSAFLLMSTVYGYGHKKAFVVYEEYSQLRDETVRQMIREDYAKELIKNRRN